MIKYYLTQWDEYDEVLSHLMGRVWWRQGRWRLGRDEEGEEVEDPSLQLPRREIILKQDIKGKNLKPIFVFKVFHRKVWDCE